MTGPRRVLVTGAGKRIGAGLSTALAEAGWHVVLHYNQAPRKRRPFVRQWPPQANLLSWFRLIWLNRLISNS